MGCSLSPLGVAFRLLTGPSLALLLAGAACGGAPGGPNVIVVTIDTVRADALSCYGGPPGATPALDALAARGALFERAYAPMAQTLPSHATLFTGRQPREHGALENYYVLGDAAHTLAERLRARGYVTAAFIGARVLQEASGIAQGFDVFDEPTGQARDAQHPVERRAAAVTDAALAWTLASFSRQEPLLLWAHYYDAHGPYEPAELRVSRAAAEREVRARPELEGLPAGEREQVVALWHAYLNEVAEVDHQVGRLLDGLAGRGLLEGAVVVVVSDHGEGLMEHGERAHGVSVFEELVHVPLIVAAPGVAPGTRVGGAVRMEDVLPLVLALAGAPQPADGAPPVDLRAAIATGTAPPAEILLERPHYAEGRVRSDRALVHGWGFGEMVGLVAGDEKLIVYPDGTRQLFDLREDPEERRDLAGERPESLERLGRRLEAWRREHPVGVVGEGADVSPERQRELEQLGYR